MTQENIQTAQEQEALNRLREILLKEDRTSVSTLQQNVSDLETTLAAFKEEFPREYSRVVDKMIAQKLKSSQQEILDVIYPVMGKMINKYISMQFQQLKEGITEQINAVFSKRGLVWWLRNRILGLKDADVLLASMDVPLIEEVFIIERDSGLLWASAALNPAVNRDVVAGMMTAIKAFVEDAFIRDNEDLEQIQYGTYRILLVNFSAYFFAIALSGSISAVEEGNLREEIVDFILDTPEITHINDDPSVSDSISEKLKQKFIIPQQDKLNRMRINTTQ